MTLDSKIVYVPFTNESLDWFIDFLNRKKLVTDDGTRLIKFSKIMFDDNTAQLVTKTTFLGG